MDIDALNRMISSGRDSAMLRFTLALELGKQDQAELAIDHLNAALAMDPNYTAAWKELGRQQLSQDRPQDALHAWQQGIEAAKRKGDKQAEKEMTVFSNRLLKAAAKLQTGTPPEET